MLLVLDNYDSFTYNLVQYLGELGADIRIYRNDKINADSVIRLNPRGIVLSPGPGRPENAGNMNQIVSALADKLPILGVCLGHQALAQTFGGTIGYAPKLMHGKTSKVTHDGSRLFEGTPSPFVATRYHSLVVERETLPDVLKVTAWTDDDVIMAMEHKTLPLFGLQFHPESILTDEGKKILGNFLSIIQQ